MNKTININLNGFAFIVEEEAYEALNSYLNTIKQRMGKNEDSSEIITDIESRIAELFRSKYNNNALVITLKEVQEVMAIIGQPEAIVDEGEEPLEPETEEPKQQSYTPPYTGRKGLYRDPDERIFGGVCAGLAAYMNIDPVFIRILAVISAIASAGLTIVIYIILWIVMPKALTLAQRLEMRGGISFRNVEDNIRREYNYVSNKFKHYKQGRPYQHFNRHMNQSGDIVSKGLYSTAKALGAIFGFFLVLTCVLSLTALTAVFTFNDALLQMGFFMDGQTYVLDIANRFLTFDDQKMVFIALFVLVSIPLLIFLYTGLKLMFHFKSYGKTFGVIAFLGWMIGFAMLFYTGLHVAKGYSTNEKVTEEHQLQATESSTIYLETSKNIYKKSDVKIRINELQLFSNKGRIDVVGSPEIDIQRGTEFLIRIEKHARGDNKQVAQFNATNTTYDWHQNDSVINLDRWFKVNEETLVRQQRVRITIQLPRDKNLDVSSKLNELIRE